MQANAIVFQQPKALALSALQLPEMGAGDVLVKVEYSGISTGTERLLWDGTMPAFPGMGYPLVPGYETVGRVVNGVVVWPEAAIRDRLGRESLVDQGIAPGDTRTLVIGATLPPRDGSGRGTAGNDRPAACLLDTAFDVDKEGFLLVKEPA
jgi:2-desacetyl-2-hydroxyethyl bacteriochlorophyllide A dehydrogenase